MCEKRQVVQKRASQRNSRWKSGDQLRQPCALRSPKKSAGGTRKQRFYDIAKNIVFQTVAVSVQYSRPSL